MSSVHPVFHFDQLKVYQWASGGRDPCLRRPDPVVVDDEDEEYIVSEIVNRRAQRRGQITVVEYMVFWEGYPTHEASWEPESHLQNAQLTIAQYHAQLDAQ